MNREEYIENILADAKNWIDENYNFYNDFTEAWDEMEIEITGNSIGSYFCNTVKAEECIQGVIFDPQVYEAVRDLTGTTLPLEQGPEICDVIVRIALMNELYGEIFDYWEEVVNNEEATA